jgi:hypothetical protein
MNNCKKLQPGQPGTKRLLERYGENLLCVRYRYDPESKRRLKTVELIVEEIPWQAVKEKIPSSQMVRLWIPYDEFDLQRQVQAARGKWNQQQEVWELPYREVLELGLSEYLME